MIGKRGAELRAAWEEKLAAYKRTAPSRPAEIEMMQHRALPDGWDAAIPSFEADEEKGLATRKASNKVQNAIAERVPWLIAGSADLTDSTSVRLSFDGADQLRARQLRRPPDPLRDPRTRRRRGLQRALALRSCGRSGRPTSPSPTTARPAIRLSALMELPVIHLFTHDSIGLGEDGPTHQPIEQLASLRAMPHLDVIRPADANEVAEAWRVALDRTHNPVALVLTRQNVPVFDRSRYASAEGVRRGGYVARRPEEASRS